MLLGFRLSLISPALYCLGILATEKLHAIFLMEINASFGRRGVTQRSTSHVLSFSTSVLLFRGFAMQISLPFGYWCFVRKEEWSCFVDQLSVVRYLFFFFFFFPSFFRTAFFSLFLFTLNWAAKKKREKKKKKEWKINREAQSDPIVSMRFSLKHLRGKHLSGGGMRPNCSQSLLILPVQSPHRAEGGGEGVSWLGGGTDT